MGRRKRHGKGVLYVGHSTNETSKREIPLNCAAREVITQMLNRANSDRTEPVHYMGCARQHHHYEPTKPAEK